MKIRDISMQLREALEKTDARYAKASKRLLADAGLLNRAETALAALGIRDITAYIGAGDNAVILQPAADERFVIRLAFESFSRQKLPQILQATHSERLGALQLELLPRVKTTGVTAEHITSLALALQANGHRFSDPKTENIGLLPDNTPVILDPGAVDGVATARLMNWIRRKKPDNSLWLNEDGSSKQDSLLPRRFGEKPVEPAPADTPSDTWRTSPHVQQREPRQRG